LEVGFFKCSSTNDAFQQHKLIVKSIIIIRWIFWALFILGCLSLIFVGLFVPETLRSLVGNGSGYANPTPLQWLSEKKRKSGHHHERSCRQEKPFLFKSFLTPFQYLLQPDVLLLLLFTGLHFTSYYCFLVTTTKQFSLHFELTALQIGLCFLSIGGGTILGSFIHGKILDRDFKIVKSDRPDLAVPFYYARIKNIWYTVICLQVVTFLYGWCYYLNAPLGVVLMLQFIGTTTL
jgi:hypothetical protein